MGTSQGPRMRSSKGVKGCEGQKKWPKMAKKGPKMSFLVKSREKSYFLENKDNKWLSWMKMLNQTCLYITSTLSQVRLF